ncbi:iron(III) transport system permease protein [Kineococcus xinjiangensis]|uniref:Iron(III) transport system permease protein n=1 Tax=Kineococcus xinjiangensis TaxID=512762 RepID=A0A2S6ITN4_9ACTN|nr:iron ABC transporter permease [Kineococcus xinjiangensis]PPK97609.1 iron(III) transport system permease protein [Kineococcus xinjiangensis]
MPGTHAPAPARQAPRPPGPRRARGGRPRPPLLLLGPAVLTAAVALLPLAYLVVRAGEDGPAAVADVLLRERTARLLLRSLALAAAVTAACLAVGVALAWLTVRSDLRHRHAWAVAAALPLAIPTYVAGFAWISFAPQLAGAPGAFLVLTACSYPYVLLPVSAALRRTDPAAEEVARSLGLTPWQVFRRVTLPQLRPALTAGGLLVSLYCLSDFGAVSILRFDTFTLVIYTSYQASFDRTPAAVLSLLLVAVTLVLVLLEWRSQGRASYSRVGGGGQRPARPVALGRLAPVALLGAAAVAVLSLGVPAAALVHWTVVGASRGLPLADLAAAAGTSLGYAALGALVTTLLAVPVGLLAARRGDRLPRVLERISYLGHALPGIVVAFSVVFLTVRYAYPLYQRTPALVLAYVVLFLPLAVGAVHSAAAQFPPALEDAARSAGARTAEVLRRVTLPLAAPGIGAGAALVFLTCMKELPATLLLQPLGSTTLATQLWTETGVAAYSAAAPYAAVLVLLSAVPTYLLGVRPRVAGGGPR